MAILTKRFWKNWIRLLPSFSPGSLFYLSSFVKFCFTTHVMDLFCTFRREQLIVKFYTKYRNYPLICPKPHSVHIESHVYYSCKRNPRDETKTTILTLTDVRFKSPFIILHGHLPRDAGLWIWGEAGVFFNECAHLEMHYFLWFILKSLAL